MTVEEAIAVFSSYSVEEKAEFLAQLMHELTVVARGCYVVGGEGLTNPQRMRCINEVQHRLSSFLRALLQNDSRRYPDDVLMKIIFEHPNDSGLVQEIGATFAHVAARHATVA